MKNDKSWQILIDTGGTFTDCLAVDPAGAVKRAKVLSNGSLRGIVTKILAPRHILVKEKWSVPSGFINGYKFRLLNREHDEIIVTGYDAEKSIIELSQTLPTTAISLPAFEIISSDEAPVLAARLVTQTTAFQDLPSISMRLATTRGTNALLEHKGEKVALFITKGFGDLLEIGTQQRPDLFALNIVKPKPLYSKVVEVPERIAADGSVLQSLNLTELAQIVEDLLQQGISAAAVALMHSYRNPIHEEKLAEFLLADGFQTVSCSSALAPFIKILPRAETAVVNAYLSPVINQYLQRVQQSIKSGKLHVMTSAGGLIHAGSFRPKDSLLSGPAGGVVGAAFAGKQSGYEKVIAFDMGGTSTDVARFDGDFEYLFEHEVGDAHLVATALAIESVAAGGGSICGFDGTKLIVGPESAGASPGPACYGAGGPLTLTDVNLLLGRLDANRFEIPINFEKAKIEIEAIKKSIAGKTAEKVDTESILEGFLHIANERMADAIRSISLRKGYDPGSYALIAFGGAGAQHACGVAERLGINTILVPRDAGLLSAFGLGHAVIERFAEQQILQPLDDFENRILSRIEELSVRAMRMVEAEDVPGDEIEIRRKILNLRFMGQDSVLSIDFEPQVPVRLAFEERYKAVYGHWPENRQIELESIRVVASSRPGNGQSAREPVQTHLAQPDSFKMAQFDGNWISTPVYERANLRAGAQIAGPALIFERHSATIVTENWQAEIDATGAVICRRRETKNRTTEQMQPEVVRLELFTNRFGAIAREMGDVLRRTSLSTNIKERLDFSCALLDPDGELVVNAPHIPVHLGAMGLCVRELRKTLPLHRGDVVMTNHPAFGGSHLPDITVVTPVFTDQNELIGYVANRAHHAEIGGIRPGSMPPNATSLAEEGVIIPPTYLIREGNARWTEIRRLLTSAVYPTRAVAENLADLRGAVAANHKGMIALQGLAAQYGKETVIHYMQALKQRAETKVREALRRIPDGVYHAAERLDDGAPLQVRIEISADHADIDFTGSADVHPGNMNATPAIVRSVVIYVLRLLVSEPLPLNEGLMSAINLTIPSGILNPPFPDDATKAPSIVGGNVETSQRLVDTLLKALHLVACSQGTMNNVLFGSGKYSYYETVCGGCGAGKDFDGASAIHSHMTNTRITDPEIVELRYPVRIEKFAIRKNSGGKGKHRGGNGVIREITFKEKMSLSVLSQHRTEKPYGLAGGEAGKPGEQLIIQPNGKIVKLAAIDGCEVEPEYRMLLKTPGGGGYGAASKIKYFPE